MRWIHRSIAFMLVCFVAAGCAGTGTSGGKDVGKTDVPAAPVKLMVYSYSTGITESEFDKFFVKPTAQKYPNITFELVTRNGDSNTPEQVMASGHLPDIVFTSEIYTGMFNGFGLGSDLTAMAKKYSLNLDRFNPAGIAAIKQYSTKGELLAIPFSMNYGITMYNKDIFNKFAVDYPKDMMTWNDMLELGKKLTRKDQGIQYIGIDPGNVDQMKEQYSLPYVDASQQKPVLDSDGYKKLFALLKQFYEVPGFLGEKQKFKYGANSFFKDQNLAILPAWGDGVVGTAEDMVSGGNPINWDIVTQPAFDDRPGVGRPVNMHALMVVPTSPNKEAAFQVINLLTSDDIQLARTRSGRLTVLNDELIKNQFGADLKSFQGKNVQAVFKLKTAPYVLPTDYDVALKKIIQNAAQDMAQTGKDVNTELREAQESAVKAMAEIKSK